MRFNAFLMLLVPVFLLGGCLDGPLGSYELGTSTVDTTCSGVDSSRALAFGDALKEAPATDLGVGRLTRNDPMVAMLTRDDSSIFFAQIQQDEADAYLWTGTRVQTETTVAEALLGADYSALLEADGNCTFDLTVGATLAFRDQSWDAVTATFTVTVDEADGGDPCDITACSSTLSFGASHVDGQNPGIQATE